MHACNDTKTEEKKEEVKPTNGSIKINISHKFGLQPFSYSPAQFINSSSDTIKFTELIYYISNISLQKEDGSYLNLGNYNLVFFEDSSRHSFTLAGIPAGTYKGIKFSIGVDSLRNHTGAQTGDLDPGYNMLWSWNIGYIFIKLSGVHGNNKPFSFHVGGDQSFSTITQSVSAFAINANATKTVNIECDLSKIFSTPNTYVLKTMSNDIHNIMFTTEQLLLVSNIKSMFSVSSVQ
jgi:hypothetical protein